MKKLLLVGMLMVALAATSVMAMEEVVTDSSPVSFDSSIEYDVYYVVSEFEVDRIESVNILGIEKISGRQFLVVSKSGFTAKVRKAYIDYQAVKAILPSGGTKPDRTIVRD